MRYISQAFYFNDLGIMFLFVFIIIVYSDWIVVDSRIALKTIVKVETFALLILINKMYIT